MIIDFLDNELEWNERAFKPTTTSKEFAQFVPVEGKEVLDVGCGIGAIGIQFSKRGASKVVAIDINEEHVRLSKENIERNNVSNMEVIQSDMFEELPYDELFDVIASDVSGIDQPIVEVTNWFPEGVPSHASDYIVEAIRKSKFYLKTGGEFYFTYCTFSDQNTIEKVCDMMYPNSWEVVHEKLVPFSPELNQNMELATQYEPLTQKGSRQCWHLWIVKCQN